MKILHILAAAFCTLAMISCGEELRELEAVAPVQVVTGELDTATLIVTGHINSIGDGIIQYGHVGSSENPNPTLSDVILSSQRDLTSPGEYTSTLPPVGSIYYYRGYAIDVHDCRYYGEPILFMPDTTILPVAAFSWNFLNCPAPCEVAFVNESSNSVTYSWDFGDGSALSASSNPTHFYQLPGNYQVRLTATSSSGQTDVIEQTVGVSFATFGSTYPEYSEATDVVLMPDAGYLLLAKKKTGSNTDIVVIKLDKTGTVVTANGFPKTIDWSNDDQPGGMLLTDNGSTLVVVGHTIRGAAGKYDLFAERINLTNGATLSPTRYYGQDNENEKSFGAALDNDGNILIGGNIESANNIDIYLLKISPNLDVRLFEQRYPTVAIEKGEDIAVTPTNEYIITGYSQASVTDPFQILFFKTDQNGSGMASFIAADNTQINAITRNAQGNYLVCGTSFGSSTVNGAIYVGTITGNGAITDPMFPLFDSGVLDLGYDVATYPNGNILIAGARNNKAFLAKINNAQTIDWQNTFFGNDSNDLLRVCLPTPDGGAIAAGKLDGSMFVLKVDSSGNH